MKNSTLLKKLSSSPKILIASYLILSAAIVAIVLHQVNASREKAKLEIKNNLAAYSLITEEAILATIDNIGTVLYLIDQQIEANPKMIQNYPLKELISHRQPLSFISTLEIRIADKNGDLKASTSPTKGNFAERQFFSAHKDRDDQDLFISEPFTGKIRNGWIIALSRRIQDKQGRFLGVVWASMNADYFGSFQKKFNLGPDSLFLVTSGPENKFLVRYPAMDNVLGTPIKTQPATFPVVKDKNHSGVFEVNSTLDKVHRYIAVTWIGKFPMLVIIGKDIEPALSSVNREAFLIFTITLGIVLLGLFVIQLFIKNFTEVSNYQAKLAGSAKLVALGEMAGAVAHEINNPLAVISAHTQIIQRKLTEEKNREINLELQKNIEKILKTIDRISAIISGLRIFSRQSSNTMTAVSIQKILDEVIGISKERLLANGVEFIFHPLQEDAYIHADETQIMQVLINLLNNSYDAIENLDKKWIQLDCEIVNTNIQIVVTDSGFGIEKEVVQRMMEPFFTTKEIGKGTGLGLSISKGIVESHNGRFYYDSNSKNTRFVVSFPLIESNPQKES